MKLESNLGKPWLGLRVLVRSTILSTIIILLFTIRLLIHSVSSVLHYGELGD